MLLFFPFTKNKVVSSQDKVQETADFNIERAYSSPLIFSPNHVAVSSEKPGIIAISFIEPFTFSGFSMYFPGDHVQVSYAPRDLTMNYYDNYYQKHTLDTLNNNSKPYYEFYSKEPITASRLEISISSVLYPEEGGGGGVFFSDLRFFERERTNVLGFINSVLTQLNMTIPLYWLLYSVYILFLFIPGFVVIKYFTKLKKINLESDIILILSPIFAIVTISVTVFIHILTSFSAVLYLYPIFSILMIVLFLYNKQYRLFKKSKSLIAFLLLNLFLIFLVMARRDYLFNLQYIEQYVHQYNQGYVPQGSYFGYFDDNMFPWRIARIMLHKYPLQEPITQQLLSNTSLFERTPILPMITTVVTKLFGESHFVYQRFLEVLSILPFMVFYVFFKKVYGRKLATVIQIMILLNIQFWYLAFNAEHVYKYFSIYPILLAVYIFFLKSFKFKNWLIAGLVCLSFLIHPSTLIYTPVFCLLYLRKYKINFSLVKNSLPIILLFGISLSSWVYLPNVFYKNQLLPTQSTRYIQDVKIVGNNFILDKVQGLAVLLLPSDSHIDTSSQPFFLMSKEYLQRFLRYSIFTNLTPLLLILAIFIAFQTKKGNRDILLLGIAPLLFYWLVYVHRYDTLFNQGGAYFFFFPFCIPFLLSFVMKRLFKYRSGLRILLVSSYLGFMILNAKVLADALQPMGQYISFNIVNTLTLLTKVYFLGLAIFLIVLVSKNIKKKLK
ncbi:MAG: hypothetical protein ABIJ33_04500 [Patescibacteria group bacterium]